MTWSEYLKRIAGAGQQSEIAKAAGVSGPTVSRWLSDQQGVRPQQAAAVARRFGRPVLEAFVAAGFLTEEEAAVRPSAAPDLSRLTNDQVLQLVRSRLREDGERGAGSAPATRTPAPGPAEQPGPERPDHLRVASTETVIEDAGENSI